jgi:hypothetical protein
MGLTPVGVQQDRVSESSTRAAESPGKRRVVALVVLAGGYLARKRTHADPGKEGLGGIPRSAPFYALASTPLWGEWPWRWTRPPMIPAVTRSFFLPTLFTRKSEHQWGHRQGQEVGRAERAEKEERLARPTSCPQDTRPTLWPGHRPFLPVMRGRKPAKLSSTTGAAWSTGLSRYTNRRTEGDQQQ